MALQDVGDGISLRQELADVWHPGGGSGDDGVVAVVVQPVHEGIGQLLDDRIITDARRRIGAGGR